MTALKVSVLIPLFNEVESIESTLKAVLEELGRLKKSGQVDASSRVHLVDDGSTDGSWTLILKLAKENAELTAIRLSRNFGHQFALMAGLESLPSDVDCVISMDADLQHDPKYFSELLQKHREGFEIVNTVRNSRSSEGWMKGSLSLFYYAIVRLLGVKVKANQADYRLIGSRALVAILSFRESNLFLRGIISIIGFERCDVLIDDKLRRRGVSKYNFIRMINLGLDGISSFTIAPLRLMLFVGMLVSFFSLVMIVYVLYKHFTGDSLTGWPSTVFPVYFLGGIQLIGLGIIGEYIAKNYIEAKRRPRYIIADRA